MSSIVNEAHPWLENLVAYDPGKPIEETARELGLDPNDIIKIASNENPLGPSPKAIEAMKEAAEGVNIYPDGGGYKLRTAIAETFGLTRENIVISNGSNEIIELVGHGFLNPGDNVIAAEHAFFAPFCFQNKIFLPRKARDNHKGKVETTRRFL